MNKFPIIHGITIKSLNLMLKIKIMKLYTFFQQLRFRGCNPINSGYLDKGTKTNRRTFVTSVVGGFNAIS